jgi:hypothetical protein
MHRCWPPIAAPVIAGLALLLFAGACAGGPRTVSLSELITQEDRLSGERILTTGVVQVIGESQGALTQHHVLQDTDANRVRLLPDDAVADYVGRVVQVEGTFAFDEEEGRRLHVETVTPLTGGG